MTEIIRHILDMFLHENLSPVRISIGDGLEYFKVGGQDGCFDPFNPIFIGNRDGNTAALLDNGLQNIPHSDVFCTGDDQ